MSGKPTVTPWKLGNRRDGNFQIVSGGLIVAEACYLGGTEQARTNAEFIIEAVNAYAQAYPHKTRKATA